MQSPFLETPTLAYIWIRLYNVAQINPYFLRSNSAATSQRSEVSNSTSVAVWTLTNEVFGNRHVFRICGEPFAPATKPRKSLNGSNTLKPGSTHMQMHMRASDDNFSLERKTHKKRSGTTRTPEFIVELVKENQREIMWQIAKEMGIIRRIIRCLVKEDFNYKSYVLKRRHFVTVKKWLPDCNPLDYFVGSVFEKEVNSRLYNTRQAFKADIKDTVSFLAFNRKNIYWLNTSWSKV